MEHASYQPNHFTAWQRSFMEEWSRLGEGRVDIHETAAFATQLYPAHWDQDPVLVAREQWDAGE